MFPIRDLNPTRIFPVVTLLIIGLNAGAFFWQDRGEDVAFLYERAAIACELTTGNPLSAEEIGVVGPRSLQPGPCLDDDVSPAFFPDKNVWVAGVVSMFLHGSFFHILSNMWFLWIFGNNVEEAFGSAGFVAMYLASGIAATAAFVLANPNETVPLVGASGAIAGVLGSYMILFPNHRVLSWILFFFVPVPAMLFLGFWFLTQFGITDPGVAWEAHAAGFAFGALITVPLRPMLLQRIAALHRPNQYRF